MQQTEIPMRERPAPILPADDRRPGLADWMTELRHILFDGTATSEDRVERLLDRMERRR
jgi:hypothetical protein